MKETQQNTQGLTRLFAIILEMLKEEFGEKNTPPERFNQLSLF